MVAYKYRVFRRLTRLVTCFSLLFLGAQRSQAQMVELVTEVGTLRILLYDKTPLHKANFLKNVRDGKYNGVLFHRVIRDFMMQSGDPESVKAKPGERVGLSQEKEMVAPEFIPAYYHKRGALAAARPPDNVNPERKSSQYQFYIVDGRQYSRNMLRTLENNQNRPLRYKVADSLLVANKNTIAKRQLDSLMGIKDFKTADIILDQMKAQTDSIIGEKRLLKFTEKQIADYTTEGGAPSLDGKYTVFGEVIQGLELIDMITEKPVDQNNRPLEDMHILKAIIVDQ